MGIREDYQAFMEKQLNDWKVQTERFKAGAEEVEAKAKVQYEKNLQVLHTKQEEAWANFHKMQNSSEGAWEQFKTGMDKAGQDIKEAAERVGSNFHKK